MGSIVVSVLGGLAVACAVWLVVTGWDTERAAPLAFASDTPVRTRFAAIAQRTSGMMAAAVVASILVPGMGGRLLMRLLAATSGDRAQGRLTDAEEIVGDVTFGGTLAFVIFIGLVGGLMSLGLFVLLRRWMPVRSVFAGLAAAGIGGGLLARPSGLIDPDNRDFRILSPTWLAIACAVAVIVLYGMLLVALVDRWATTWPPPGRSTAGVLSVLPGAVVFAVAAAAIIPALVIALLVMGALLVRPRLDMTRMARAEPIGRTFTVAAALIGAGWVAVSAIEVFRL